jgi:DNA-binding MarR family transcriptional regulator
VPETSPLLDPQGLGDLLQLDRARTSRAISSLLAKGLLLRTVLAGDQRRAKVALTAAGLRLHGELFPLVAQINQQLLRPLDGAEVALLDRLLQRIQQQAEQELAAAVLPKADRRQGRRGKN